MNEQTLTPPYSEQAEQSVLGAILSNNDYFDDVSELITATDFYNRGHREIFTAIAKLIKSGQAADAVTISGKGDFDLAYCVNLVRNCPSSKNALVYASVIKRKSIQRDLIGTCNEIAEQAYQHCENELELVSDSERQFSRVTERLNVTTEDNSARAALKETYELMEQLAESESSMQGISTGLIDLDDLMNGLKKSTMILLAARPGMGKTTLALNIVEKEAMNQGYPLVFSIEMPKTQVMFKMLSSNGNVPLPGIMRPKSLDDFQWAGIGQAMTRLKNTNLEIIDRGGITVDMMRIECRRYLRKYGRLTLIVIDYVQLVNGDTKGNRTNEMDGVSRGLKALAKEFDCPVLVLSQLSRDIEKRRDKTPLSSDLRESGQLEQDAEEILFIHSEEEEDKDQPNDGLAKIIITKIRMGKKGSVVTEFNGAFSKFTSTNRQWVTAKHNKPYAKEGRFEV